MQVMLKTYILLLFLTLILIFEGCEKDLTPADNTQPEIKLKAEDVGVTEVWLKLQTAGGKPEDRITITRNDSTIIQLSNLTTDTLIYDSGLLPNHEYIYSAVFASGVRSPVSSLRITTMDTTSHNFTWQSWTFGAKGSSILYDVAIIDENNIWAVGEIYTEDTYTYDSLGNWIPPYNAVHWNGSEWELERILYQGGFSIIKSIFAFSGNDIWFEAGIHWNGEIFEYPSFNISFPSHVNKMWGTSSHNLYIIGNNGLLAHYNGQTWQRIESGTQNNLHDIWGIYDEISNEKTILVSARDKILKLTNDSFVEEVEWTFNQNILVSVWFNNLNKIFACGDGAFTYSNGKGWEEILNLPNYFTSHIRGIENNDIFVAGSFGLVAHYNGLNWKIYSEVYNALYRTIDDKNNLMIAVGERNSQAVILMMNRN